MADLLLLALAGVALASSLIFTSRLHRSESRQLVTEVDSRLNGMEHALFASRGLERQAQQLGLVATERSICDFDYGETFRGARHLTILMNDGQSWLRENLEWIERGTVDMGLTLHVILVHPESSFVPLLAHKQHMEPKQLADKIRSSATMIDERLGESAEVWGHTLPTSYSLVMSESTGVFMPYPASRERGRVPAFVFRNETSDGFLDQLRSDIEALRVDCRSIREPAQPNLDDPLAVGVMSADFEWKLGDP